MDTLEKLKHIITDDIYNEIEEAFIEKDSRISELESEKEDLEYEVSNLESEISYIRSQKDEFESELFEINNKLNYYIDDYIQENFPTLKLILKSEYDELKEEHEKYREGWTKWEDNKDEYEYFKKSTEWDNLDKLCIKNPPSDIGKKGNNDDGSDITYWVNYVKEYNDEYGDEEIVNRIVYKATRSVWCCDCDEPWELLDSEIPDFKMIGYLKVRYYRCTKKKTKEIVYFKDLLNKYFNLLKENKSTKL